MAETIRLLQEDHKNLAKLLKVLERQIAHFEDGGEVDFDIVRGALDYCLNYPDLCHHPKEDLVFQHLLARDPRAADMIGDLEADHRGLAEATRKMAAAVHQLIEGGGRPEAWFGDTARTFLDAYWRHMEMEETTFFPIALQELTDADWAEIDAAVTEMTDPLFSGRVEERYKVLRNEVLLWDEITP